MKSTCSVKDKKSYRCVKGKWNPELSDSEKLLNDQKWLQLEYVKVLQNKSKVKELMITSYSLQHKTINDKKQFLI